MFFCAQRSWKEKKKQSESNCGKWKKRRESERVRETRRGGCWKSERGRESWRERGRRKRWWGC